MAAALALSLVASTLHTTFLTSSPLLQGRQPSDDGQYHPENSENYNLAASSAVASAIASGNTASSTPQSAAPSVLISNAWYTFVTTPDQGINTPIPSSPLLLAQIVSNAASSKVASVAVSASAKPQSQSAALSSMGSSGSVSSGQSVTSQASVASSASATPSPTLTSLRSGSTSSSAPPSTSSDASPSTTAKPSSSSTLSIDPNSPTELLETVIPCASCPGGTTEWVYEGNYTPDVPDPNPTPEARPDPSCILASSITWGKPHTREIGGNQPNDKSYNPHAIYPIAMTDSTRADVKARMQDFCGSWDVASLAQNKDQDYPAGCVTQNGNTLFCQWVWVGTGNNDKVDNANPPDFYNWIGAYKFFRSKPGGKDYEGPVGNKCSSFLEHTLDSCYTKDQFYGGNITTDDGWTLGWYPTYFDIAMSKASYCAGGAELC